MKSSAGHTPLNSHRWFIILLVIGLTIGFTSSPGYGHEPIFGLGPHTIYKGGIGLEMEFEAEHASSSDEKEKDFVLHNEIIYGVTADFAVTLSLPYVLNRESEADGMIERSGLGLGETSLRMKYRFRRRDRRGVQDSAAFIVGAKFPTGDVNKSPRHGSGSVDFLLGLTAWRESLLWYYFGDIRYRLNRQGSAGIKAGDRLFADAAIGIRPWPADYQKPDLVVLVELNWETLMRSEINGHEVSDSGGHLLFLSPSFFLTYRNWALKGGVQVPLDPQISRNQPKERYRFKLAIEIHF